MTSKEIRQQFIDFFKRKEHLIVPSAPMVLHSDPTLMFTNAGMNQFKDFFLGNADPKSTRIADTQKCLRVSGKHNDLEEVGIDTYHHTMFEMLGNWSFGDYFKKEAISWAWEILTEVYKLPKERLYVTVFGGDEHDGLEPDQEACDYWKAVIDEDRIIYCGKKDNFWEMGDVGPCGPCSEIHIDLRSDEEIAQKPGKELVNVDHPELIEIWNLVFIQFERLSNKSLKPLPEKHIDTGMGFERLCMVIQGKKSSYDSDVFTALIAHVKRKYNDRHTWTDLAEIAVRVIVDHIRAISFAIADGQLPSNNKAGYVIRRILRRAVRYGYQFLFFEEPFLFELVPVLAKQFDDVFPELESQKDFISKIIHEEERSFLKTLESGINRIDYWMDYSKTSDGSALPDVFDKQKGKGIINGEMGFQLYDTYGFPVDLTQLILKQKDLEHTLTTNWEDEFDKAMKVQKERSKSAAKVSTGDWDNRLSVEDSVFKGWDENWYDPIETSIVKHRKVSEIYKSYFQIVLGQTPFYAESGGQVGDTGYLEAFGKKTRIIDTRKENDMIVHVTEELPEDLDTTFKCVVDREKRIHTMNNHSATHLMHAALREVLGDHVQQRGSLVNEKLLRFDFSHFAKMTKEELKKVETIVNQKIRDNIARGEDRNVPIEEAKKRGAMALFGEKYGDFVRVITFDKDFSVELCGGTHVKATGNIGLFKIVSEGSVAAGVRRIEAITSERAEAYINDEEELLNNIRVMLKNPPDVLKAVESLAKERDHLSKQMEKLQHQQVASLKSSIIASASAVNGVQVIVQKVELPSVDSLKKLAYDLRDDMDNLFLILAADIDGRPQIAVMASDDIVSERNIHAGNLVKELAKEIKGGGGGQPFFATAGGSDTKGLDQVLSRGMQMAQDLFDK